MDRGSVRYALMDLRRLELPDACCRGIWCSVSLLHIPKRTAPRAAAELVPYPIPGIAEMPRFYAYYEPEEARGLLAGAGLEIVEQETVPDGREGAPAWVAILARREP